MGNKIIKRDCNGNPILDKFGKEIAGRRKKGGVMIMDEPSQFHNNVGLMPPALASYNPPVPSVSGAGKKRVSARGAIVAKIMKEKGLNLSQASKYVKENNLY